MKALRDTVIFLVLITLNVPLHRNFKKFVLVDVINTIPPYQPPKVEYFNNNLCSALITYHCNLHSSLDEDLTYLQLAFNTAKHEAIGTTPLKVIFPFH
jgi:hypothetical protein